MTVVPTRSQVKTERDKENTGRDGDRDWREVSAGRGAARVAGKPQKREERHGIDSPSQPPGETNATDALPSDVWPPRERAFL